MSNKVQVEPGDYSRTIKVLTTGTSIMVTKLIHACKYHDINVELIQVPYSDRGKLPGHQLVPMAYLPSGLLYEDSTEILKQLQEDLKLTASPPYPTDASPEELVAIKAEVSHFYHAVQLLIYVNDDAYNRFDFCGNHKKFLPGIVKCCPCICNNTCCQSSIKKNIWESLEKSGHGDEISAAMLQDPKKYIRRIILAPLEARLNKTQKFILQDRGYPTCYDFELLAIVDLLCGNNANQFHSPVWPDALSSFAGIQTWYQRMCDVVGMSSAHYDCLPRQPLKQFPTQVDNPGKGSGRPEPMPKWRE